MKNKNFYLTNNRRWNLYINIAIENDTLVCANERYPLTEICNYEFISKPCTLLGNNEEVDIGITN